MNWIDKPNFGLKLNLLSKGWKIHNTDLENMTAINLGQK